MARPAKTYKVYVVMRDGDTEIDKLFVGSIPVDMPDEVIDDVLEDVAREAAGPLRMSRRWRATRSTRRRG